jgi:hypothetical protein
MLGRLSQAEINEFGQLVHSPFFNRNQSVIKLYEYLRKLWPDFEPTGSGRKTAYKKIFESPEYNDGFMRVLISKLTKLLEEYLTQVNFRERPQTQKIFLLTELNLRKLEREFRSAAKDAEKILLELPQNTMHYYYDKALLEDNKYFFNSWSTRTKRKSSSQEEASLKLIIDNFTRFYLLASLTMYRKVQYIRNYGKINIDLRFIEDVMKTLEVHLEDFNDTPIINLYTNEILLLTKGDRKYFNILKSLFLDESHQLTYVEIYSLHNILQRFLTKQILAGKRGFKNEKLMLYKNAVHRNILVYPFKNHIEEHLFISIVNSALSAAEISWAVTFTAEYAKLLQDEKRHSVEQICLAKIDLELGKYNDSLLRLKNIKTKSSETMFQVKVILLRIYFELSLFDEADLVIDTMRHLFNKAEKTMASVILESYRGFLKFYSILIKAKEKNKTQKLEEVYTELKKSRYIEEHPWILKKSTSLLSS